MCDPCLAGVAFDHGDERPEPGTFAVVERRRPGQALREEVVSKSRGLSTRPVPIVPRFVVRRVHVPTNHGDVPGDRELGGRWTNGGAKVLRASGRRFLGPVLSRELRRDVDSTNALKGFARGDRHDARCRVCRESAPYLAAAPRLNRDHDRHRCGRASIRERRLDRSRTAGAGPTGPVRRRPPKPAARRRLPALRVTTGASKRRSILPESWTLRRGERAPA